jgi:phosphoglycerate dehydrogenase-like enzyme
MIVKILGITNLNASELEALGEVCELVTADTNVAPGDTDRVIARARDADVIGVNAFTPITAEVVAALPRLRAIVTCSAGTDHIDLDACRHAGITVYSFPAYCARTVAEKTVAYILMGLNHIVPAIDSVRIGNWAYRGFQGREAPGRTVAVIGHGGTGGIVARFCEDLGFTVETMNSTTTDAEKERILAAADVLTLHMPLNDRTRHFLNAETLALLKEDVVIVNTARGGLVDDAALAAFLLDAPHATAFLDVLTTEPPGEDHPYHRLHNVVITPHISWNSVESDENLAKRMARTLTLLATGTIPLGTKTLTEADDHA